MVLGGLLWLSGGSVKFPLGRLPGDILIQISAHYWHYCQHWIKSFILDW